MRPRERRETSEQDLFRSRLDQIIDMKHALVKLGQAIDWRFLEERFGAVYTDKPSDDAINAVPARGSERKPNPARNGRKTVPRRT